MQLIVIVWGVMLFFVTSLRSIIVVENCVLYICFLTMVDCCVFPLSAFRYYLVWPTYTKLWLGAWSGLLQRVFANSIMAGPIFVVFWWQVCVWSNIFHIQTVTNENRSPGRPRFLIMPSTNFGSLEQEMTLLSL